MKANEPNWSSQEARAIPSAYVGRLRDRAARAHLEWCDADECPGPILTDYIRAWRRSS